MICLIESTPLLHAAVLDVLHANLEQTPKALVICHSSLTTRVLPCLSCKRREQLYMGETKRRQTDHFAEDLHNVISGKWWLSS